MKKILKWYRNLKVSKQKRIKFFIIFIIFELFFIFNCLFNTHFKDFLVLLPLNCIDNFIWNFSISFIVQSPLIGLFVIPYLGSIDEHMAIERRAELEEIAKEEIINILSSEKNILKIEPKEYLPIYMSEYFLNHCNKVDYYLAKLNETQTGVYIYAVCKDNTKVKYPYMFDFNFIKTNFIFKD